MVVARAGRLEKQTGICEGREQSVRVVVLVVSKGVKREEEEEGEEEEEAV